MGKWVIGPNFPQHKPKPTGRTNRHERGPNRPGAWSTLHDACVTCHRDDMPHAARGQCRRCYARQRYAQRRTAA